MANKENTTSPTEKAAQAKTEHTEAEYSAAEFAASASSIFGKGATPDCVIAAFRMAGVKKANRSKAKEIVSKFLQKEVK